jgi:hypothetical protein
MVDLDDGFNSGIRMNIMQMAQAICVVDSPRTSKFNKTATGSCIECAGKICLITSSHVVNSFHEAENTKCYFNAGSVLHSSKNIVKLAPALFFWCSTEESLDCVIVALDIEHQAILPLVVENRDLSVGLYVHVWGHPNLVGKPLQQASGKICRLSSEIMSYRANTLDGFSGAPVFSLDSGLMIGIHCSGPSTSYKKEGNVGILLKQILCRCYGELLCIPIHDALYSNWDSLLAYPKHAITMMAESLEITNYGKVSSYPLSKKVSGIERLLISTNQHCITITTDTFGV